MKLIREFIIFARKILCIVIVVYLSGTNVIQKVILLLVVNFIFAIIQIVHSPYMTKMLNFVEINQILTILGTVILSIFSEYSEGDTLKVILASLILIINLQFLFFCFKQIIISRATIIKGSRVLKSLNTFISKVFRGKFF